MTAASPNNYGTIRRGDGAVSYTHLDVYKRQGQENAMRQQNEAILKEDFADCFEKWKRH